MGISERRAILSNASHPVLTIPVAAADVGYHTTKFSLGRIKVENSSAIKCQSFPSIAPRVTQAIKRTVGTDSIEGVSIKVNGNEYFVGTDSALRSNGRDARVVLDKYAESDEYKALFLGALYYIAKHALDNATGAARNSNRLEIVQLVLGLPLNTIDEFSKVVKTIAMSAHELPPLPRRDEPLTVVVKNCEVVAQPQGALLSYGATSKSSELFTLNNLVLDMGGGTFDWFLCFGNKPVHDRSGAYPKGMLSCAFAVCDQIKQGLRNDPIMLARVDEAVRTGKQVVRVSGKETSIAEYLPSVDAILTECINRMLEKVGNLDSVDQILVTGGGAKKVYSTLAQMMPERKHMMHVDEDPQFSNVRGFHLLGEMLIRGRA